LRALALASQLPSMNVADSSCETASFQQTKLAAAAAIAAAGKNVTIARCGTVTAELAIGNHPSIDGGTLLHSR
jgi:lipid A disaccharide synthetase